MVPNRLSSKEPYTLHNDERYEQDYEPTMWRRLAIECRSMMNAKKWVQWVLSNSRHGTSSNAPQFDERDDQDYAPTMCRQWGFECRSMKIAKKGLQTADFSCNSMMHSIRIGNRSDSGSSPYSRLSISHTLHCAPIYQKECNDSSNVRNMDGYLRSHSLICVKSNPLEESGDHELPLPNYIQT